MRIPEEKIEQTISDLCDWIHTRTKERTPDTDELTALPEVVKALTGLILVAKA